MRRALTIRHQLLLEGALASAQGHLAEVTQYLKDTAAEEDAGPASEPELRELRQILSGAIRVLVDF